MAEESRAAAGDAAPLHQAMVEHLLKTGMIQSPHVEAAFRAVPRHLFLPHATLDLAYANLAVPTKWLDGEAISSASQPGIVAIMLEQLAPEPGQRVLEIGAGTGYNAALLAHLVGDTGAVISMDIDEDIVASAREHLEAAGSDRVQVCCANGMAGYPDTAPYDRIILTVGAREIAVAWLAQLAPAGRLVLPLAIGGLMHRLVTFTPEDDHLVSVSTQRCHFMLLRPAGVAPVGTMRLNMRGELLLRLHDAQSIEPERITALLQTEGREWQSGIRVTVDELVDGLCPWLDVHEPGLCTAHAMGAAVEHSPIPPLLSGIFSREKWCATGGWIGAEGICLLACPANRSPFWGVPPFEICLRSHGPVDALAERVLAHIAAWQAAGRPSLAQAQLRAYPPSVPIPDAPARSVVSRGEMHLVVNWR